MAEKSIVFDLHRTPNFVDNMNRSGCFDVNHMDGSTKRYEFVLASNCGDNIEDNLTNNALNNNVTVINVGTTGQVALKYTNIGGNNRTISSPPSDLTITIGNNDVFLKGLFLRDRTTGYVLAYSIFDKTFPITNEMVIPKNRILWTIKNESD